MIFVFLVCIISLSTITCQYVPLTASENYPKELAVSGTQYKIFWKLLSGSEIQFEVHCRATGWIGIGFSRSGGMDDADIAFGWVKNGQVYLKDAYAIRKALQPSSDPQQDFILLGGAEINGYTILKFKRKYITNEPILDVDIVAGPMSMIFAWNSNSDPVTGDNDWLNHGPMSRLASSVTLI